MKNFKTIFAIALSSLVISTSANARNWDNHHSNKHVVIKSNNTIVKRNNFVSIQPVKAHKTVVVKKNYRPTWSRNHVVVVEEKHDNYDIFKFAMKVIGAAIVIDQVTQKPYTENGQDVIVKEISCSNNKSGHTQVVESGNNVILLVCE